LLNLIAVVDTPTSYIPEDWVQVSGGIGFFTPANMGIIVASPDTTLYVMSILQDPSLTSRVDPIDPSCTPQDNCVGYLLTTGIRNIAPLPYIAMQTSNSRFYIVKNAPSYQLDIWNVSPDVAATQWSDQDCSTYGVDDAGTLYGFQICATFGEQGNVIRACKRRHQY
jgi:hypothetical protein